MTEFVHFALDPDMTEDDWVAAKRLASESGRHAGLRPDVETKLADIKALCLRWRGRAAAMEGVNAPSAAYHLRFAADELAGLIEGIDQ